MAAPAQLITLWRRLLRWPGGRLLFSWILRCTVPYSGTISPRVLTLEPGHARVALNDRRRVRNHLRSIHAIAIANLGELTSGLAMTTALPPDVRGIVVRLNIEYLRKARGTLIAESRCVVPAISGDSEYEFSAEISNEAGEPVARVTSTWRLGPAPQRETA
jgi:acyl-coenzyme A thioesterase PaaI-like protein